MAVDACDIGLGRQGLAQRRLTQVPVHRGRDHADGSAAADLALRAANEVIRQRLDFSFAAGRVGDRFRVFPPGHRLQHPEAPAVARFPRHLRRARIVVAVGVSTNSASTEPCGDRPMRRE